MLHHLCLLTLAVALGAPSAARGSAAQEEPLETTWARLTRELDTLLPGAPTVAATWTTARELREGGNTPPAELEAVSRTRVTRALGSELALPT